MSMERKLSPVYDFNEFQLEIVIDCLYYWAKMYMNRIVEMLIIYREEPVLKIMKKYRGICNPSIIENTATTYDEEVEKLAECLEHNRAILKEIAEVLGIDINVNADPELCIEEAIEWTLKSQ